MNPLSIVCFLPLIPIFLFAWLKQRADAKTVAIASKTPTNVLAKDALVDFLQKNDAASVEVVASSNYSQNEYVEKDDKIYLSPETIGDVDVASLALVLRAGSQAILARKGERVADALAKTKNAESLLFWVAFCVLAFGIMGASPIASAVGYGIVVVVWLARSLGNAQAKKYEELAIAFVKETKLLPETKEELFEKTLAATRRPR